MVYKLTLEDKKEAWKLASKRIQVDDSLFAVGIAGCCYFYIPDGVLYFIEEMEELYGE